MEFTISPEEEIKIKKFKSNHEKKCKSLPAAIGGRYTYLFIPTSIGTICKCQCYCGKLFDATNYKGW